jgi:hypothetical protein
MVSFTNNLGVQLMVDVIRALSRAIETIKAGHHDPAKAHERVKGMYAWSDVAERTEVVYYNAMSSPRKDTFERLSRYVQPTFSLPLHRPRCKLIVDYSLSA